MNAKNTYTWDMPQFWLANIKQKKERFLRIGSCVNRYKIKIYYNKLRKASVLRTSVLTQISMKHLILGIPLNRKNDWEHGIIKVKDVTKAIAQLNKTIWVILLETKILILS